MTKKQLRFITRTENRVDYFLLWIEQGQNGEKLPKNFSKKVRGLDRAVHKSALFLSFGVWE